MAKGRPTIQIKRVTRAMGETVKAIARTGLITSSNASTYFGLNAKATQKLIKNNFIRSETIVLNNRLERIYRLERSGEAWVKSSTEIQSIYRSNSQQAHHDAALSHYYCNQEQHVRESWMNETQIIRNWSSLTNNTQRVTSVDALISVDGIRIAVEVITSNYGAEDIQLKEEAATELKCEKIIMIEV